MDISQIKTEIGRKNIELITTIKGIKSLDAPEFKEVFDNIDSFRADFIALNDNLIIEMKEIRFDRDEYLNIWLNNQCGNDQFLRNCWFGRVPVSELINKHPDPNFETRVLNFIYRGFIKEIKHACLQIRDTKIVLKKPNAHGMLSIAVATDGAITKEGLEWVMEKFLKIESKYSQFIDIYSIMVSKSDYSFASSTISLFANVEKDNQENLEGLKTHIAGYMQRRDGVYTLR